ncbi:hypothetical protein [Aeromicrobium sp. Sec7.5]|uniref:hypothetical protein n=1 Tax=Aeromicrobium sp. Sec7.5 TaxID=3121276 RepID=UPI002FE4CDC7
MVFARASAVIGLIGAVLVVIGSIGPWATVAGSSVGGLDGDGWITLVLALLAGGFCAAVFAPASVARIMRWFVLPWVLIALLVAVIDIVDISSTSSEFSNQFSDDIFTLSVGWGLWLVLAGSIVALVAAVALMIAPMPAPPRPAPFVPGPYVPGGYVAPGWQQPYPGQYPPQPYSAQYPPQPYPPQPYAPQYPNQGPPQPYPGQYPPQAQPPQPYPPQPHRQPPPAPAPPAWPTTGPAYPGSTDSGSTDAGGGSSD